jgi:hypothetical protein
LWSQHYSITSTGDEKFTTCQGANCMKFAADGITDRTLRTILEGLGKAT